MGFEVQCRVEVSNLQLWKSRRARGMDLVEVKGFEFEVRTTGFVDALR